ncbi:Uncharacterised protein [Streptococcus pneumoniae]|nr:Uncharacterised protein [Streptococcus pneumoniae]
MRNTNKHIVNNELHHFNNINIYQGVEYMKHRKKKMISIFAIISIFLLLMGCDNKKEETLADKAFEEMKKEGRQAVLKIMPYEVNSLISNIDDVVKQLDNKATTDKELKENLKSVEMYAKDVEKSLGLLPEEYESVETNLKNLSKNSKTFITESVKFHQGKDNTEKVKKLLSEMLEDFVAIKKVLPLDDEDNGFYSVSWMEEFIQK